MPGGTGAPEAVFSLRNRRLAAALRELGFSARYEELDGAHDWDFWTAALRRLLDWLPLRTNAGIHSGNVGL